MTRSASAIRVPRTMEVFPDEICRDHGGPLGLRASFSARTLFIPGLVALQNSSM